MQEEKTTDAPKRINRSKALIARVMPGDFDETHRCAAQSGQSVSKYCEAAILLANEIVADELKAAS